jgi:23S rRNA (guanosine2251-2'-O)-methyltransferase
LSRKGSFLRTRKKEQPGRSKSPEEWIYGLNPVLEAVRSGRKIRAVFLSLSRRDKNVQIEKELTRAGLRITRVDEHFFDSRFRKGHQGIAAAADPRTYADLDELLQIPRKAHSVPLFLLLDCIEDPRNLGALLRVADAGGVHGVVIQEHRAASLTPEAVKASAGSSEHVRIAMVPNIKHAIKEMKEQGIFVLGAEAGGDRMIWDMDLSASLALVIGSEGTGMRRTVKEACDAVASLPMRGSVNSLNASVAAGIIIFEIMRQRMRNN